MQKQIKIFLMSVLEVAAIFLCTSQMMAEIPYITTKSQDCGQNYGAPKGRVGLRRIADPQGGWQTKGFVVDSFGPMPQTAYDPNFGCYPGNARTIHRYPAFHGYYYDRPYNYRHYTEYPWNAEIVEPRPYEDYRRIGTKVDVPNEGGVMPSIVTPATEESLPNVPATEAPATEAPAAETPVTEAPVTDVLPEATKTVTPTNPPAGETILDESTSTELTDDLFN